MKIFGLNITKAKEKKAIYKFDDEDRQLSLEIKKQNAEQRKEQLKVEHEIKMAELQMKKLEHESKMEELKYELYGDDEDNEEEEEQSTIDKTFGNILEKAADKFFLKGQGNEVTSQPSLTASNKVTLSQEKIEEIYNQYKPYIKRIKKMSDEEIKTYLSSNYPQISEKSINDLISRVRT